MKEEFVPIQSKSDKITEQESMEQKVREHVDLRLRFAQAMSDAKKEPLAKCLDEFTDLRLRIMGSRPREVAHTAAWQQFTNDIESTQGHEARLNKIMERYREPAERIDFREDPYWPFRYDYVDNVEGEPFIATHFGSLSPAANVPEGPGLLSKERYEEQRAKLKAMFAEIKQKYPEVEKVRGRSWAYNLEAYRRLYPSAYGDSRTLSKGGFHGGARWGQFRTSDGGVNPKMRETFLENLKNVDPENPEAAFPMQTWQVQAPISEFYKEYGIE